MTNVLFISFWHDWTSAKRGRERERERERGRERECVCERERERGGIGERKIRFD